MMDASRDYTLETGGGRGLREFVKEIGLVDMYRERFPREILTFVKGTKRLDCILMDLALEEAVKHEGYSKMHEGAFLDHVHAYVDFDVAI